MGQCGMTVGITVKTSVAQHEKLQKHLSFTHLVLRFPDLIVKGGRHFPALYEKNVK